MPNTARRLKVVHTAKTVDERLREAFPEVDFDRIAAKGAYNHHNLQEKWDSLCRQVEWWLNVD